MTTKKAKKDADNLSAVLKKIPEMFGSHASIGERLHEIITTAAPDLKPRLWYGMPGYAKGGPVLVFFRHGCLCDFRAHRKSELQRRAGASVSGSVAGGG